VIIKRIAPLSCAKIVGVLYLILGFIVGAFVSFFALLGGLFGRASQTGNTSALLGGAIVGVGAIVIFPILYGALGFIGSLIAAALYNVLARSVGGIEIEVESLDSAGRIQSGSSPKQFAQPTDYPAQ
jgi:hypothetical protein